VSVAESPIPLEADRYRLRALGVGVAVLALSALVGFFAPDLFFPAYLVAFNFWLAIALGSLALLMIQHLTGGQWGAVLRPVLEAASRTLPLLALFFVPLLLGLHRLYPWTHEEFQHEMRFPLKVVYYLNVPFFLLRAALYFAVWIGLSFFLNRWSRQPSLTLRQDRRYRLLSAPGIALYGLTITFAAIDWLMSLEPDWFSTIYGVMVAVGQLLTAFAFAVLVVTLLAQWPPMRDELKPDVGIDLGNLLLAFTMLWAYLSFSQFLLIWSGNLPEEITWYLRRLREGWEWVAVALVLFQFFVPLFLLLSRDVKRVARRLAAVAGLALLMRFVDFFWLVAPASEMTPSGPLRLPWLELLLTIGLGGVWSAYFLWQLAARPLIRPADPIYAEAPAHD
jgi:hypothetical protein